jgi:hypothetical protein
MYFISLLGKLNFGAARCRKIAATQCRYCDAMIRALSERNHFKGAHLRIPSMTIEFTKQAEELLKAAREARIPDNVKAFAEEGVASSRKAFDTLHSATRQQAQQAETVLSTVHAGSKSIADTVLSHSAANAEATFAAALKIVRAPTLPEAARLQAEFVQSQIATASQQTQELFQLSSKVATSAMEQFQSASAKLFGQFGKTN